MRTRSFALLGLFIAALGGCPTPPDAASGPGGPVANGPGGPGGPGAPGGEGGPGAQTPGAPGGPGTPPEPGAGTPGAPPNGLSGPPSFDTLIQGGETITVTVTVKGGTKGQIDFMQIGEGPKALHVQPFEGEGPHKITAPAKLDDPVYVSAVNFDNGAALGPNDVLGSAKDAVKFAGADLSVTVDMSYKADWLPKADPNAVAPGGEGPSGPAGVPPGDGSTPPPGAPASPPEGGAPGAPPAGGAGAPPAGGAGGAAPTP